MEDQHWRRKELRVVLLGWDSSQSSLVGNAILGHETFDTERDTEACLLRQGIGLDGAQLTVVNTPQSWLHYSVNDPAFLENRMATGASLCPPGPHVLLLVVPVSSLPNQESTLEAALVLLSEVLWRHTMVVFTSAEKLTESRVEAVAKEYGCLQSALEKCGHRYHCLNTTQQPRGSDGEVQELLKNMRAVTEGNQTGGHTLCIDTMLQESERRTMKNIERAKERLAEVQKRYQTHKLLRAGSPSPLRPLRAVMLGVRKAGKSTVGNVIFGHEVFQSGQPTQCHVEENAEVVGKHLTLVDTPGWPRACCSTVNQQPSAKTIASSSSITEYGDAIEPEFDVFLLVIRCSEAFTDTDKCLLLEHMRRWGNRDVWQRSIVLFTWGDRLGGTPVEQHIERWPALVWLVEKCGNRYHVLDNVSRTCSCKVKELLEEMEQVSVINDSHLLLQMLLQAQREKKRQRSKVKELQKTVKDLQRDYQQLEETLHTCEEGEKLTREKQQRLQDIVQSGEQREKLLTEEQRSLQETLQSCEEREKLLTEEQHRLLETLRSHEDRLRHMAETQKLLEERLTKSEMEKKKLHEELEQLGQRCHEQDRLIDQMRREQMTLVEDIVYQEQDPGDHTLGQTDQNNTVESVLSGMKGEWMDSRNQWQISSKDLHQKRELERRVPSLVETNRAPDSEQIDIRAEDMSRSENIHRIEPAFVYVELDCSVPQKAEPTPQPVPQHRPQQQEMQAATRVRGHWLEGAAIGAVIGSLKGLHRGPQAAVVETAMGATLGALLHILYLRTKGKL